MAAVVCWGHTHMVNDVDFAPDGARVASASDDCSVRIFERSSGHELLVFLGHKHLGDATGVPVNCVRFAPDGALCASGDIAGNVLVWDSNTHEVHHVLTAPRGRVTCLAWSNSGHLLATARYYTSVCLYDTVTGNERWQSKRHAGSTRCLVFSDDGLFLFSAADNQTVQVCAVADGKLKTVQSSGRRYGTFVALTDDCKTLVNVASDGEVSFWDLTAPRKRQSRSFPLEKPDVARAALSKDGSCLASVHKIGATVHLSDVASGKYLGTAGEESNLQLNCVAFSADGQWIAAGSYRTVCIWPTPEIAKLEMVTVTAEKATAGQPPP